MRVEIFRLTGEPITVDVRENGTVKDVFSHPESGKVLGRDGTLMGEEESWVAFEEHLRTRTISTEAFRKAVEEIRVPVKAAGA